MMTKEERLERVKAAKAARETAVSSGNGGGGSSSSLINENLPSFGEAVIMALKTGGEPSEVLRMAVENFAFGGHAENYNREYVSLFHKNGIKKTQVAAIEIVVDAMVELFTCWGEGWDMFIEPGVGIEGVMKLLPPETAIEPTPPEPKPKPKPKAKAKAKK